MYRKIWILVVTGALGLMLAGCGQTQVSQDEQQDVSVDVQEPIEESSPDQDPAEPPEESVSTGETADTSQEETQYEDNFAVDTSDAQAFAKKIQTVVAEQDFEGLADLISYPVYIGFPDKGEFVETKEDFINLGADRIFTADLLEEISGADLEALSPSMAGFVLSTTGVTNIVFGVSNGALAITGINY